MAQVQYGNDLNSRLDRQTLAYYDSHADEYARQTAGADLNKLYERFLPHLPVASQILDIGCGGGRDMRAFKMLGFDCLGIDPAPSLARIARKYSGCEVIVAKAEEIKFNEEFEGAWACASLLHLPRTILPIALVKIHNALKAGGAFFLSMQEGIEDCVEADGRFFARYTSEELLLYIRTAGFKVLEQWCTADTLPGRREIVWLNVLAEKPGC